MTIATFDDTRMYISADAPEEFDRALADFLAGRPHGKSGYNLPRRSPRASVMQAAGATCLAVDAGKCLLLDGQKVIDAANAAGITIIANEGK